MMPGLPYGHTVAPHPQVVHVVAKPGGFTRALQLMVGLMAFAAVFLIGIGFGAVSMLAGSATGSGILEYEYRSGRGDKIAIIPLVGEIDGAQAGFIRSSVDTVLADRSVDAVILRVDSPGGGVTASDQIWYQVNRLKASGKPVLASYGGVAASGGYYATCHVDHITAEETGVTGSIGVIAQTFIVKDLLDKVGVEPVTLLSSATPEKDVGSMFREWETHERDKIIDRLDSAYDIFLTRVEQGRGTVIGEERLHELANGSVYTSDDALANGLIDGIGYLDDAIAEAERRAGIATGRARVVMLQQPPSLFGSSLLARAGAGAGTGPAGPLEAESIRRFVNELGSVRIMYRMR